MAECKKPGYAGSIGHTGMQVIQAPFGGGVEKGKGTVKKGNDLRK